VLAAAAIFMEIVHNGIQTASTNIQTVITIMEQNHPTFLQLLVDLFSEF
jgi:hypothetical protein